MTTKITDLEGRLEAAFKRADKVETKNVIGRYRMRDLAGLNPAEIVFVKVTHPEGHVEFVTWERNLKKKTLYRGNYFETFRLGIADFLKRIDADNGGLCSTDCDHYHCPMAGVL